MHVTDTEVAEAAGRIAGRYILGASLRRGGMAEVVRAHDERTGRDVAVKMFRADVAEARDLRRIRSEIRMLAGLNHPSLVQLYDASTGDEHSPAYLILELVDGPTLADLIRVGLPPHDLVVLLAQASDALAYIHARGIVHRDVKPENILVGRDAHGRQLAKLADLGIARIVDETRLTVAGGVIGTAAYLSPEQVTGDAVGTATDIYALGLVLLEGLTGRRAFAGTGAESAVGRTVRAPRLPEGLTPSDADLLRRMTALDPESRIDAASARERLIGWSSPGPFWADRPSPARTRPVTAVTERIAPPPAPPLTDYAATRVLGAAPPAPVDSPTGAPISRQSTATDVFAQLGPSGWTPAYRPASDRAAPYRPASDDAHEPPPRARRSLARRMSFGVVALLVLGGATAAIWPTAVSILTPAPIPPPPAYPAVDGQLGADLIELQTSLEGGGLALEALNLLRSDALTVSTAAAGPDLAAASTGLDVMTDHLDAATIDDQITSARYRTTLEALGAVQVDVDAAIAAEQAAAEAAAEHTAAEQSAAEQAAAEEAAAEEAARQAEEESNSGTDVLGDLQSWWDEQVRQLEAQFSDSSSGSDQSG